PQRFQRLRCGNSVVAVEVNILGRAPVTVKKDGDPADNRPQPRRRQTLCRGEQSGTVLEDLQGKLLRIRPASDHCYSPPGPPPSAPGAPPAWAPPIIPCAPTCCGLIFPSWIACASALLMFT